MAVVGIVAAKVVVACTGAKAIGVVGTGGFGAGAAVATVAPVLGLITGLALFGIYTLQKGWQGPPTVHVYAV